MPGRKRLGLAWPPCPKCGSKLTLGTGEPPAKCEAECKSCSHKWQVCGEIRRGKKPHRCSVRRGLDESGRCRAHPNLCALSRSDAIRKLDLGKRYEQALEDNELLSARRNVAMLEGLIVEQLEIVADPPEADWSEAKKLWNDLFEQWEDGADHDEIREPIVELGKVLREGASAEKKARLARDRIVSLMESQSRHQESQVRREALVAGSMTYRQAVAFAEAVQKAIETEVDDPAKRQRIAASIAGTMRALAL